MTTIFLIQVVRAVGQIASIVVIVDVFLGYFMSPDHAIRHALDGLVEPLLRPIRKLIPSLGGLDFSPVVLILAIQLLETLLERVLISIG